MPITKPYRRTCRQLLNGGYYAPYSDHPAYAKSAEHYVRAYLILLKDLEELFDFVEPADSNLSCHSYRIHALLMRACIEIEANCKAIMKENGFAKRGRWNIEDYWKIERTHFLSKFQVKFSNWNGAKAIRTPFENWNTSHVLEWYQTYNATKHDRHDEFNKANFGTTLDAVAGLLVMLTSQFLDNDFKPKHDFLVLGAGPGDGFNPAIGERFSIKYPDVPEADRYDFHWPDLKGEADPFQNHDYNSM